MTRSTILCGAIAAWLLVGLAGSPAAQAHFIWADVEPQTNATLLARFYFGELPRPGEPELIGKIAQTRAWVRGPSDRMTELKLARSGDPALAALVAPFTSSGSASLEATCDYGVFQRGTTTLLLQYYAKHLPGNWVQGDEKLVRAEGLRLDIVPTLSGGQLGLRVVFEGKPDAGREVIVLDSSGKQHELKTDDEGRAAIAIAAGPGAYAVRAAHVEAERGGERDGKTYSQTWHYCTLTLDVPAPAAASADVSAAELLSRARTARCVWRDFPGFSADLTVDVQGHHGTGRVIIDAQGEISLELADPVLREWTQAQLSSLVQHRLPDDSIAQGKVTYADDEVAHPLGRKMGKTRFTISVLEATRDVDDKYLPRSFTMNSFDDASGTLKSSRSFWNEWQRVGAHELPKTILEIGAQDGSVETKQVVLNNWRLKTPK